MTQIPQSLELHYFKELMTHHLADDDRLKKGFAHLLDRLQALRLLPFLAHDATAVASPTRAVAKGLLRVWNSRLGEVVKGSHAFSRFAAVMLVKETVHSANFEVFSMVVEGWVTTLMGLLKKKEEVDSVRGAAVLAITAILCRSTAWPETRRDVLKNVLPQFLPIVLKSLDSDSGYKKESLMGILLCLKEIKDSMKSQLPAIKVLCTKLLGSNHTDLACSVLSVLPNEQNLWLEIVKELTLNLEKLLNVFFAGWQSVTLIENEFNDNDISSQKFLALFSSHAQCLKLMLGSTFNFTVNVPFEQILKLLVRIFNVDGSTIVTSKSTNFSNVELFNMLPSIHISSYLILEAILKFKTSIYPQFKLLSKILIHGLNCGTQSSCYPLHSTEIRCTQYSHCELLLSIGGASHQTFVTPLIEHALDDVKLHQYHAEKHLVRVTEAKSAKKQKRKRGNKEFQQMSIGGEEVLDSLMHGDLGYYEVPLEIQKAALRVLNSILVNIGSELDQEIRSKIDKSILSLVLSVFNSPLNFQPTSCPLALQDKEYRSLIYLLLKTSLIAQRYTQSPLLPYATKFFNFGLNDPSMEVANICRESLSICSLILHPVAPPLHPKEKFISDNTHYQNTLQLPTPSLVTSLSSSPVLAIPAEPTPEPSQPTQIQPKVIESEVKAKLPDEPAKGLKMIEINNFDEEQHQQKKRKVEVGEFFKSSWDQMEVIQKKITEEKEKEEKEKEEKEKEKEINQPIQTGTPKVTSTSTPKETEESSSEDIPDIIELGPDSSSDESH